MGEESAMSSMSGMSGMESSQSQGSTGDAPAGGGDVDNDDDSVSPGGGGSSSSSSSSSPGGGSSDSNPFPGPEPPAPTPEPPPKEPPKNFVMCTVGVRFRDPGKYKDVPCDYIIFDNMVVIPSGIIPSQDFIAWQHFLEFIAAGSKQPMPGISLMGAHLDDPKYDVPEEKTLTSMADKGIVAYGISSLSMPKASTDLPKLTSKVTSFFSALTAANSTIAKKGGYMTMFCLVEFQKDSKASFEDFLKQFTGNLLVVKTHNMDPPAIFPDKCIFYHASMWNDPKGFDFATVEDSLKSVKSLPFAIGVTFSMAVQLAAFNKTGAPTDASAISACVYRSVTSYDDWCPLRSSEKYDATTMAVVNVVDIVVVTYNTEPSAKALIAKFKQTVKLTIGVLLTDIQFDIIETSKCTEKSLSRVKSIGDLIRGQGAKPSP
ncbi:uncharacterized protein LOC135397147 [Ornithodoros turicata]|uniref:uncharacterized protein LOC135397147 n=1 Tax=Ornithodoros turicata TaxID=34597 RepID=UPI003139FCEA